MSRQGNLVDPLPVRWVCFEFYLFFFSAANEQVLPIGWPLQSEQILKRGRFCFFLGGVRARAALAPLE
jgi:hypothetical protein